MNYDEMREIEKKYRSFLITMGFSYWVVIFRIILDKK